MKSKKGTKKGMSASFLVGIIITLAAFMIIAIAIKGFMEKAEPKEAEMACQGSVALRAAAAIGGEVEVKLAPVLCKTIDKKIEGDKEEIKRQLADLMARCWWMFNAGRTQDLFANIPGLGGKNKGFVCYTAIVEENKDFKEGDSIKDFDEFLRETDHPKLKDVTYLKYFQYEGGGPGRVLMFLPNGEIKPDHAFEIAFIEKRGEANAWMGKLLTGAGAVAGATGIIVLAIGTGGLGVIALTVGGIAAAVTGASISFDELFKERDVSTIMLLDMENQNIREEFHKNVFTGDIAGE